MKKILFLQIIGNVYGGVWFVNKTLGEGFINKGYDVYITSIRNSFQDVRRDYSNSLNVSIINEKDKWEIIHLSDIEKEIKDKNIVNAIKLGFRKISDEFKLKNDLIKTKKYIEKLNPDYILVSHYELLDFIPKNYLNKTFNVNHSSFQDAIRNRGTKRVFSKYKDKVPFVWLTKRTMEHAIEYGIKNNTYIYNPVRYNSLKRNDVLNNKRIIVVSRLSSDKRIDLMINCMNQVFENKKYSDWTFEIYGIGELEEELKKLVKSNQIILKGKTDLVKETYSRASFSLNTSPYEGFALSILEANACGVPVVSLNFGESVYEEIIDNKTGFITNSMEEFKEKVIYLMDNPNILDKMSEECFKFSKKFNLDNIILEWEQLFEKDIS